jgi:CubicO group peptidase (beta-lactamase class C family)
MVRMRALEPILLAAVADGVTPGGVVAVGDGDAVQVLPFGLVDRAQRVLVVAGTVYDVASLTKPAATLATLMRLCEARRIALDTPARALLPELTGAGTDAITIAHLAGHSAGFPAHVLFYERIWAGDLAGAPTPREALVRMAAETPLESAAGAVTRYSDVGYILLGAALERAGGARLDELARAQVFEPLGMSSSFFVDLDRAAVPPPALPPGAVIAPTEECARRGLVRGEVHDENAHAGGGIAGHAGLFSTAGDLSRFATAVIAALRGEPGLFAPALARHLATTPSTPGSTWRLGWDTPSLAPGTSTAGDLWPKEGIGHLGFTGCSLWLDGSRRRHVVLLTNRVHPTRHGSGIFELRRAVMEAVTADLDARR